MFDFIMNSIEKAGYKPGKDIFIALMLHHQNFLMEKNINFLVNHWNYQLIELIKYYKNLIKNYPIISIEDGLDENDWDGWNLMTKEIGKNVNLLVMIYFVTSVNRLKIGIKKKVWKFNFN